MFDLRIVVMIVLLVGVSICSVFADDKVDSKSAPSDWTITRREFRKEARHVPGTSFGKRCRLIVDSFKTELAKGESLQLFTGVEQIVRDGDVFANPFTKACFPDGIAVIIYDSDGRFLKALPDGATDECQSDDGERYFLHGGEMRGKTVEISTRDGGDSDLHFTATLTPGTYQVQLVASGTFFLGDTEQRERDKSLKERWRFLSTIELARSNPMTIVIRDGDNGDNGDAASRIQDGDLSEKGILLSTIGFVDVQNASDQVSLKETRFVCTFKNVSRHHSVGLIDPFHWLGKNFFPQPIRWQLRRDGINQWSELLRGGMPHGRDEFIILPPQCVVSCPIGTMPTMNGEYEISVDLIKGIVVDPGKLEIMRTAKRDFTVTPSSLGGVDPSVIHTDSVLKKKFVVK